MTDTAIEQRDEAIAEALVAGRSVRLIQREFSLTVAEIDQALERCFPLDTAARLRMIRGDLGKLDRLIDKLYEKGLAGDTNAATACIRAWERKAALVGLDAAQRIDLQITPSAIEPVHEFDKIYESIMRVARGPKASNGGAPDAPGAVSVLSDFDGKKPSS